MSTHTPGPWEVEYGDNGRVYGIVTAKRDGQSAPNQDAESKWSEDYERIVAHRIRIVETDSGCYPPREADARLIAAAPELLEALLEATGRYQGALQAMVNNGLIAPQFYEESLATVRRWTDIIASIDGPAVQP